MATIHKLTKDGATIFPATITDAVVHPNTGKTLTSMIKDYNVSELFPSEGIDGGNKYNLALAISVLGTHLTAAEKTGGIKLTFISSLSPYPEEEYFLGKSSWSTTVSDWKQRFEVGDVIADPSGSWEPSTAQQYIDQQVAVLNTNINNESISRQTADQNLQTQVNNKLDKTLGVTSVNYDTTNKKITKTINGVTSDVVTALKIVTDGGGGIDISGKVDKTTTVNGHALSSNVTVTKSDVGLGNVVNTGDSATPISGGTTKFTTGGAYTELAKKADKTEVNTALATQQAKIDALDSHEIILGALPSTGVAGKVYRVPNDPVAGQYTDYGYNAGALTTPIKIATYQMPGIDNEPTAGSDNLVKSGGVASKLLMDFDMSSHWIDDTILYGGSPHVGTIGMAGWATTDFITLEAGESIISILGGSNTSYWAFTRWNYETEALIDGYKGNFDPELRTYTAETKCKVRISTSKSANPNLICYVRKPGSLLELQSLMENIQPSEDESVWKGKKVGFLGDSTISPSTATSLVQDVYVSKTGCTKYNYAIGGTSIAKASAETTNNVATVYTNASNDLDMVVVLGGVNDFRSGIPLGDFKNYNSDGSLDNTFYGALHTLARGLKGKYPDKPVVFLSPLHNQYSGDGEYNEHQFANGLLVENKFPLNDGAVDDNTATGGTLKEYIKAIKDICELYSIHFIDLHAISGIQPLLTYDKTNYMPDGIHPSTVAGSTKIVDAIYPYLEQFGKS